MGGSKFRYIRFAARNLGFLSREKVHVYKLFFNKRIFR